MQKIQMYEHKVQYYETDQMGIVHHSNYVRWFEEARTDLMEQAGMSYAKLEEEGIVSAVLEVHSSFRSMVHFGDTVIIETKIEKYNSAVMIVVYQIKDKKTKELRCIGETKHCFLDKNHKLLALKKTNPQYHQLFSDLKNTEWEI